MMISSERTSQEWFAEAVRCYVERHQGCAWCGGSHRVLRRQQGDCVEYYCTGCDFRTAHDPDTERFFVIPGADQGEKSPETMFEI
jgi:hypothetical protein